ARSAGSLRRHDRRRAVGEQRCGRILARDRAPPARDLFGGSGYARVMRVLVPTMLRSYTGGAAEVDAGGATVGELLDDLDRRFPGMRFRVIDEQQRVRQHVRIFVNGDVAGDLSAAL